MIGTQVSDRLSVGVGVTDEFGYQMLSIETQGSQVDFLCYDGRSDKLSLAGPKKAIRNSQAAKRSRLRTVGRIWLDPKGQLENLQAPKRGCEIQSRRTNFGWPDLIRQFDIQFELFTPQLPFLPSKCRLASTKPL